MNQAAADCVDRPSVQTQKKTESSDTGQTKENVSSGKTRLLYLSNYSHHVMFCVFCLCHGNNCNSR